ncbi:hypothetical protein Tco_0012865 [Tanacetum coccineum]
MFGIASARSQLRKVIFLILQENHEWYFSNLLGFSGHQFRTASELVQEAIAVSLDIMLLSESESRIIFSIFSNFGIAGQYFSHPQSFHVAPGESVTLASPKSRTIPSTKVRAYDPRTTIANFTLTSSALFNS